MSKFNKNNNSTLNVFTECVEKCKDNNDVVVDLLVVLFGSIVLLGVIILSLSTVSKWNSTTSDMIVYIFSSVISFLIFPFCYIKKKYDVKPKELGLRKYSTIGFIIRCFSSFCIVLLAYSFYDSRQFFYIVALQNIFVAITEEFLFRGVINYLLIKIFDSKVIAYSMSTLLFVFILHSNSSFTENIIFRLPVTIILSIVYFLTNNLGDTILIHWIYNIIVSNFFN